MIIVTGGAGFIGSNLVAALEERGAGPLVVCDNPGAGEGGRTIAGRSLEARDRARRAPRLPPGPRRRGARGLPPRRQLVHDRDRREPAGPQQLPLHHGPLALVRSRGRAADLRLVGGHLRRRLVRLRRRRRDPGAGAAQAAQRLRPQQAPRRPPHRPRAGAGRAAPAAVGRPQVLQRLRPQRVSQGRAEERGRRRLSRRRRRPPGAPLQVPRRALRRTAASAATSSGSATASR